MEEEIDLEDLDDLVEETAEEYKEDIIKATGEELDNIVEDIVEEVKEDLDNLNVEYKNEDLITTAIAKVEELQEEKDNEEEPKE